MTSPSRPPSGRREHRKHLTRRELLAAGRRLFAERGLYDSRIEDLSRQAGIAKGTLYGYFANKEELIEAVVTNGFSELLGHVHRAAQGAASREDAVARVAAAHLAFFDENPDLMRVFHQVRGMLTFRQVESRALREVLRNHLTALAQVLALSPSSRASRGTDDLEVAILLFGAVSGVTSVRAAVVAGGPKSGGSDAVVRALVGLTQAFETPARGAVMRGTSASRRDGRSRARAAPGRRREGAADRGGSRARRGRQRSRKEEEA